MHRMVGRCLALAGLAAAATAPLGAAAEVLNGSAAKVPPYQARGATEINSVGPLAPSLQGKPVVVRIHADWCAACKATQATIDTLKQAYGDRIAFVQFDVTNAKTAAASEAEARRLGLDTFYDTQKTATSTVAIIDPKDGKIFATFYNDSMPTDYQVAIDGALKSEG